jgi:hypothetical protein
MVARSRKGKPVGNETRAKMCNAMCGPMADDDGMNGGNAPIG